MDIALLSPSSLLSEGNGEEDHVSTAEGNTDIQDSHVERRHQFPGMELIIREFSFHQLNANLLWPGTFAFAEWLVQHKSCSEGRRIIELGRHFFFLLFYQRDQTICLCYNYEGQGKDGLMQSIHGEVIYLTIAR